MTTAPTGASGAGGRPSLLLLLLAYLGFVSIGLPDGLLGVAWPSIRATFGLRVDAIGPLLVAFTVGYLASSSTSGRLISRMNVGALLAWSCLTTSASLAGYALAPVWPVMVASGFLAGLGAGAIDAGINTYAARRFSARTVNWLHGFYGVGATGGPLLMTTVLGAGLSWRWGYAIVGAGQLALAVCFALTRERWAFGGPTVAVPPATASGTLRLPTVWVSGAIFFAYTGLEAAAGTWAYSLFTEARGVPAATAGVWSGVYFGSLTAGRFASGAVAGVVPVRTLLRLCICGMGLGAAAIWADFGETASFLGLTLVGACAAPVFPSLIASTPERFGDEHTANAVGFQIASAVLGASLIPSGVGLLAGRLGLEIVGPALAAVAAAMLVLYEALGALSARKK